MKILVCGTRNSLTPKQTEQIRFILADLNVRKHILIDGMAFGVDSYAHRQAKAMGWGTKRFPADWERFGKSAGPIRNQQMIDETEPDLVIAFPAETSSGTWDMVERAVKNRIPVRVYPI